MVHREEADLKVGLTDLPRVTAVSHGATKTRSEIFRPPCLSVSVANVTSERRTRRVIH